MSVRDEMMRADLIKFPPRVDGTRCTNCRYFEPESENSDKGHCIYDGVFRLGRGIEIPINLSGVAVSNKTCCIVWDAPLTRRLADERV